MELFLLDGIYKILVQIGLTILIIIITRIINYFITKSLTKSKKTRIVKITNLMQIFLSKVLRAISWIISLLIILFVWGLNLTPVFAGLGVTGVVLAFALQESIASLFSGFMLAINSPFNIGDLIEVGSIKGRVVSMDMMSVSLNTLDNKQITMANKLVWGKEIINYNYQEKRRVDLKVSVAYNTDIDKAREIINKVINSYPEVLQDPKPIIEIDALASSSVDFIVFPWVNKDDYFTVLWRFNDQILKEFKKANIEIPYNKLDVIIKS